MKRSIITLACLLLAGPRWLSRPAKRPASTPPSASARPRPISSRKSRSPTCSKSSPTSSRRTGATRPEKFCVADDHRPHQNLDRTQGLVSSSKVKAELPTALDSSHQSKLDKLKGESGKDFSSDFDSMQVSAHKDAVSLFERYAKGGDNADLKNWAGKTLPTLKHHLEMAQNPQQIRTPTRKQSSR